MPNFPLKRVLHSSTNWVNSKHRSFVQSACSLVHGYRPTNTATIISFHYIKWTIHNLLHGRRFQRPFKTIITMIFLLFLINKSRLLKKYISQQGQPHTSTKVKVFFLPRSEKFPKVISYLRSTPLICDLSSFLSYVQWSNSLKSHWHLSGLSIHSEEI